MCCTSCGRNAQSLRYIAVTSPGDVLMHVCFYAMFGAEKGQFDLADVCDKVREKLIFRHPHIYGNVKADTPDAVADTWEQRKQKEKAGNWDLLCPGCAAITAAQLLRSLGQSRSVSSSRTQDMGKLIGRQQDMVSGKKP